MTHYVGPRATVSFPTGTHACPRCEGRGSIRHTAGGRVMRRVDYGRTGFWRTCSRCRGVGHIGHATQELNAA